MDGDDRRLSLPLHLWAKVVPYLPGDVRRKASRLIAKGDHLSKQGKAEAARVMYTQALHILEDAGVHHLRKKVQNRLLQYEEAQ